MALKASSRLIPHKKAKTLYLTIPSTIAGDSAFPFRPGNSVTILIKGRRLIVSK